MTPISLFRHVLVRLVPVLILGWTAHAIAQSDPPGRIGRLNHAEGAVTFSPSGDNEWTDAEANRPLTRGDKLWTDKGSRAEVQVGSSTVRMDGQAQIQVLALDDQSTQLSVTQGSVYVRVRNLPEGENFEIDTPNLAWRAAYPGDYRIDVDGARGTTRVTVHSGTGAVYGDKGQSLTLGGGQQVTFRTRGLAQVTAQESPPQDNFDRWAAERNRREDQSVAARYVPREVVGYQGLDAHGQWSQDATYGAVWIPQATPAKWAPYRAGRWEWIAPWGWSWIDDAPWAFATSHYGRWAMVGDKWAWVPGRIGLRPIYAPALVAFLGSGSSSNIAVGGKQGVAWFPLAPGEAWQPGYRATPLYISTINANMPPQAGSYAHQRRPEALTAIAAEDFHRGRPVKGGWMKVAGNLLVQAQVVPPPPMPDKPAQPTMARAAPVSADVRQVTNNNAAIVAAQQQQQAEAQRQRDQAAQAEQAAKVERQAKAEQAAKAEVAAKAEQAKAAEQARAAQQAKLADQGRAAEQARVALAQQQQYAAGQKRVSEQARAAEHARIAEQLRQIELAKATEQVRTAQQVRSAEQARANQQARAVALAQARVQEQQALRAEAARHESLARRAELAKREQASKREQALREQLAQARREKEAQRAAAVARAQAQREAQREALAKRAQKTKLAAAAARKGEDARKAAHAQQVEVARRAADRDAQALRQQRVAREEGARKQAEEREHAQREAWQRQQQALSEQWRRDQQAWEQQQRDRARPARPDLRNTNSDRRPEPEVWQRGIPILNPGRTS